MDAIRWEGNTLYLLDQTKLPVTEVWLPYTDYRPVADAIRTMVVRGAPAIGVAAAYAYCLAALAGEGLDEAKETLAASRPTAVNLFWALERMEHKAKECGGAAEPLIAEAKAIHAESPRRDGPFICVNCGAIPDNLLESELFGYEEGAFTGAKKGGKPGKFQLANHGTLFLDEIGDMPLPLQVKILRALQEREIEKVGGGAPMPVDVRVISATRQDLPKMMAEGSFREDLYYRLAVINMETVPLRERPGDILLHANYYLDELNKKYKTKIILSDPVKCCLRQYNWPGNVRELQNVITGAYASCDNLMVEPADLPAKITALHKYDPGLRRQSSRLADTMDAYESAVIREALCRNGQNVKAAAEELGVERSLLYKKMKRLQIIIQRSIH